MKKIKVNKPIEVTREQLREIVVKARKSEDRGFSFRTPDEIIDSVLKGE